MTAADKSRRPAHWLCHIWRQLRPSYFLAVASALGVYLPFSNIDANTKRSPNSSDHAARFVFCFSCSNLERAF